MEHTKENDPNSSTGQELKSLPGGEVAAQSNGSPGEGRIVVHVDTQNNQVQNNQVQNNQVQNNQVQNNQVQNNQLPNNQLPNNQAPVVRLPDNVQVQTNRIKRAYTEQRSTVRKSLIMQFVTSVDIKRNITVIANERTLFSYYRTALGYMALCLASFKMYDFKPGGIIFGLMLATISIAVFVHGRHASKYWFDVSQTGIDGPHNITIQKHDPHLKKFQNVKSTYCGEVVSKHDLACIRTALANTRTFLAYQRTSMPLFAMVIAQVKIGSIAPTILTAILALYFVFDGFQYWWIQQTEIDSKPPSVVLSTKRTVQANRRTILAYLRTIFGFVAVGVAALKLLKVGHPTDYIVGISFINIAVVLWVYGVASFVHTRNKINARQDLHQLAVIRTVLANVRTYLANIRTFHPLAAFSFSMINKYEGEGRGLMYASFAMMAAVSIWIYGGFSWYLTREHIQTDPSTHHLAVRRTELSNTRTFLANARVGMSLCTLAIARPDSLTGSGEYGFIIFFALFGFFDIILGMYHWIFKHQMILSWPKAGVE